jgi:hemoglobin
MPDITTRQDIELLVDKFYGQVIEDDIIGEFFTGVVKLDWTVHIPIMYNFWRPSCWITLSTKAIR